MAKMAEALNSAGAGDDSTGVAAHEQPPAVQQPAAEVQPPATEQVPAVQQASDQTAELPYYLPETGVAPKDLQAALDGDPALKAALDAKPELKDALFAATRVAERGKKYDELFGSPRAAEQVAQQAAGFTRLMDLAADIKPVGQPGQGFDREGTQAAINAMLEVSALRDDQGNILRTPGGAIRTDGTVTRLLTNIAQSWMERNILAKLQGDDEALASLDLVMERAGLRPSTADQGQESEEIKQQRATLERERNEIAQQRQTSAKQAETEYNTVVETRISEVYDGTVGKLLEAASGLTPFAKEAVQNKILAGLKKAMRESTAWKGTKRSFQAMPLGKTRSDREVAAYREFIHDNLARVAQPILGDAGVHLTAAQAARSQQQTAREQATRGEVQHTVTLPGNNPPSREQLRTQVTGELQRELGRQPNQDEIDTALMFRAVSGQRRVA